MKDSPARPRTAGFAHPRRNELRRHAAEVERIRRANRRRLRRMVIARP
jgi:hypothetical protein